MTIETPSLQIGRRLVKVVGIHQVLLVMSHLRFAIGILLESRRQWVIVREFVTIPLLLTYPLWCKARRRILFINNHNFQYAQVRWSQGLAIRLLLRLGARIVSMERPRPAWGPGKDLRGGIVLPFPMIEGRLKGKGLRARELRVGILSGFRSEQGTEELLEVLLRARTNIGRAWRLVLASRFESRLVQWEPRVDLILNLRSTEDYWNALADFDVAVFNYNQAAYEQRTSGIISDAIACGTPVVCPAYPVLLQQITWPAKMGVGFRSRDEIADRVSEVSGWSPEELLRGSRLHQEARGVQGYRKILKQLECEGDKSLCFGR